MSKNPERLYKRWLRQNGLPDSFPSLRADIPARAVYKRLNFGTDIDRMMRKVSQQIDRLVVLVPPGQGASTLAQQIIERDRENSKRGSSVGLLVYFNASVDQDIFEQQDFERVLTTRILVKLVNTFTPDYILSLSQGSSHLASVLYVLLGVPDFDAYEDLYDRVTAPDGAEWLYQRFAAGELGVKSLPDLIASVKSRIDLSVILMVKISSNVNEDDLLEITSNVKWYAEQVLRTQGTPQFASKLVLFCSQRNFAAINTSWGVSFDKLEIEPYSQAELWQILSCHYQPKIEGDQIARLTDILHQDFMQSADPDGKDFSLNQMVDQLRQEIVKSLAKLSDDRQLPRQLTPAP